MDGFIQNHAIETLIQFDVPFLSYNTPETGAVTGGDIILNITEIRTKSENDEFGKVKEGHIKATGIVKKAYRSLQYRVQNPLRGIHELESNDGSYIGFGWWDEDLEDRDVLVCPVILYTQRFKGYTDVACLLLAKVDGKIETYTRCGRARIRFSFFREGHRMTSLTIV